MQRYCSCSVPMDLWLLMEMRLFFIVNKRRNHHMIDLLGLMCTKFYLWGVLSCIYGKLNHVGEWISHSAVRWWPVIRQVQAIGRLVSAVTVCLPFSLLREWGLSRERERERETETEREGGRETEANIDLIWFIHLFFHSFSNSSLLPSGFISTVFFFSFSLRRSEAGALSLSVFHPCLSLIPILLLSHRSWW